MVEGAGRSGNGTVRAHVASAASLPPPAADQGAAHTIGRPLPEMRTAPGFQPGAAQSVLTSNSNTLHGQNPVMEGTRCAGYFTQNFGRFARAAGRGAHE